MSTTEGELETEVANEIEEGEILESDVEDGTYIPLVRPETFNPPSLVSMQIQDEASDEETPEESSGSESDSGPRWQTKRSKIRPRRPLPQSQDAPIEKNNKYNVWNTILQEDLLTEDMVGCDVTKGRNNGVESYDYRLKYTLDDNVVKKAFLISTETSGGDNFSNKRTYTQRNNVKLRLGKRDNNYQEMGKTCPARILEDLVVTAEDAGDNIANDIASKLKEDKTYLIVRAVQILGANAAIEIYKETQKVEAGGGMLIMNGTRRRTSGGVYLMLLKRHDSVSQAMVNDIFNEERKETRKKRNRAKNRKKVVEQLKQSLADSEIPSLLSRSEATIAQNEHGSNPPPSPATDARDCSSDTDAHSHTETHPHSPPPVEHRAHTALVNYDDDDVLEVMCNDEMDLF